MSRRLATVAAFNEPVRAELARTVLEAAGIPAAVADAEIVAMDWLLANAVGGIKVQVREEDAARAAAVLDARFGPAAGLASDGVPDDELARQALAAGPADDGGEEPEDTPADEAAGPPAGDRDGYAGPALVVACVALVMPPLLVYAGYLWLNAALRAGPLSVRGRWLVAAGGVVLPLVAAAWVISLTWPLFRPQLIWR